MDQNLQETWGILFKGRVLRINETCNNHLRRNPIRNICCYEMDFLKSLSKVVVITTKHDVNAIPILTENEILSQKRHCMHYEALNHHQLHEEANNSNGHNSSCLSEERVNIFYYPKTIELVPNIDKVIHLMVTKHIVAMEIKISNVQVLNLL